LIEFTLLQSNLEYELYCSSTENVLLEVVRPAQIVLCIARAYRSLGHNLIPDIIETNKVLIPYYVIRTENLQRLYPAAGLPYRLLNQYQFKPEFKSMGKLSDDKVEIIQPDVCLETLLAAADPEIIKTPASVHIAIIYVPFYKVLIPRGKSEAIIFVNAYNSDVILEQPPPQFSDGKLNSSKFTAVFIFAGLVCVITTVWLLSGSMSLSAGVTCFAGWMIRKLISGRNSE